ncbi:hypothetical protein HWV62_40966 [Athelia sp. TMB]|nr:hypothetical protein HWV62_40966 [Athelia sp. TMB]
MVNTSISDDRKACALDLWNQGWQIEDICLALAISRASLYRWRAYFDQHGNILRPRSPLVGRHRTITLAAMTAIRTVYDEAPGVYLDELCTYLAVEHDMILSTASLSRTLDQAGLTRKKLKKIAIERDEALRQEWRNSLEADFGGDGNEFICVDEMSKNEHTWSRGYGRSMSGERAELTDVFVRGDRYSLVAAITTDGYIAARVVPGSFDALEFYEFVCDDVVSPSESMSSFYSLRI